MEPAQITRMFGDVPQSLFRIHNWRTDVMTLGEVQKVLQQYIEAFAAFVEKQNR